MRPPRSPPGDADDTLESVLQVRFGANFRLARKAMGLTQEKVALLSDIGQSNVSAIERGRINLTLRQVERLALVVEQEASTLLNERARFPRKK